MIKRWAFFAGVAVVSWALYQCSSQPDSVRQTLHQQGKYKESEIVLKNAVQGVLIEYASFHFREKQLENLLPLVPANLQDSFDYIRVVDNRRIVIKLNDSRWEWTGVIVLLPPESHRGLVYPESHPIMRLEDWQCNVAGIPEHLRMGWLSQCEG